MQLLARGRRIHAYIRVFRTPSAPPRGSGSGFRAPGAVAARPAAPPAALPRATRSPSVTSLLISNQPRKTLLFPRVPRFSLRHHLEATMKKLFSAFLTLALCSFALGAEDKSDVQKRLDNAATVLEQVSAAPDKGIPESVMSGAKCVAVVPHMIKGGFGIGGQHGKGVATCKTSNGG